MSAKDVADRGVSALRRPMTVWREKALGRAIEMETLLPWFEQSSSDANKGSLVAAVRHHLKAAREGVGLRSSFSRDGASIERTIANLDAARLNLLRLAPPEYLLGNMPNLLAEARQQLRRDDPRRQQLEVLALQFNKPDSREFTQLDRYAVVAAVAGAAEEGRRSQSQLRTFSSVIYFTAVVLILLAAGAAFIGWFRPSLLPLCFLPEQAMVVCPTGLAELEAGPGVNPTASDIDDVTRQLASPGDIILAETLGLFGAAVASAAALRRMRGTVDAYRLPVALAILKLPTGMLTAFLGLTLIRAQFVPGLTALDSSAQIIAWAVILGYAQELFTRAVDARAATVIEQTTSSPRRNEVLRPEPLRQADQGVVNE